MALYLQNKANGLCYRMYDYLNSMMYKAKIERHLGIETLLGVMMAFDGIKDREHNTQKHVVAGKIRIKQQKNFVI